MAHFDINRVSEYLNTKYLGRSIIYNHETKTTMDDAEVGARVKGNANGTVYIADRQTGARGTKGHTWKADSTGNLYFTFIIYQDVVKDIDPYRDRSSEFYMDISCALATLQTLEEFGLEEGKIKWLNDLWVRGHKLCGALAEYKGKVITSSGGEKHLYLAGIGVNVNCDMRHHPTMYHLATSTWNELGSKLCREEVFAKICNRLEPLLEATRQDIRDRYEQYALFKNGDLVTVTWSSSGQQNICELQNVRDDWSMDLKDIEIGEIYNVTHVDASVRPKLHKCVCVLSNPSLQSWSHDLALKSCCTLVDTSEYIVSSLSLDQIKEGVPSSCKLIVIGEWGCSSVGESVVSVLKEYVKQGGACLCVGNGHGIFQLLTENAHINDRTEAKAVRVKINGDNSVVHMFSLHESTTFGDALEIQSVLAVRKHEDDVDENETTEVFICGYGAGKLAVCLSNIEVSFSDIEYVFPCLIDKALDLQSTAYQKDCLFKSILQCLGI